MRIITRDKEYYSSLVRLAVPVALQGLITFLVSFADNLMVNSLGDAAVSGVYMGSQIQTLLQMFTGGIGSAIVIISAQYWGKNDVQRMRVITATGLRTAIAAGIVFTLLGVAFPGPIIRIFTADEAVVAEGAVYLRWVSFSYLFFCITQALIASMRSVEVTQIGMWVSLASLVVNISVNYVLIFGKLGFPAIGVKGAAIATVFFPHCGNLRCGCVRFCKRPAAGFPARAYPPWGKAPEPGLFPLRTAAGGRGDRLGHQHDV